ncbi:alanine--glyoxylate aminotransferase family protein [Desulfobacterota bacterium AH_259_B03_O07]|nr:alanine--glyoxylate aminotransferase family protein [Desulfobacterota bacterium AH_259_B03_O07]
MKKFLFTPGPVPVPEEVLSEMSKPIIHHRTEEFESLFAEIREGLRYIFGTKEEVFVLASSGTGAMDAAVANTLSRGDKVLVINGGKFGERWGKICSAYGLNVKEIKVEWGEAVDPDQVKDALENDTSIRAVLIQASETSTGVKHPTTEVAEITRERDDVIIIVDGITAVGVFPLPFDDSGIDVLVGGSQKAFMLPPGLAFVSMSEKAWRFNQESNLPKFYFDLKSYLKSAKNNTTPWTPAITLVIGLALVLRNYREQGLEKIYNRHANLALATREAMNAIGLEPYAKNSPSPALTAVVAPPDIGAGKIISGLRDKFGMTVAGGQDQAKGKIFRISHIGFIDKADTIAVISAVESILKDLGYSFDFGSGLRTGAEILAME